MRETDKVTVYHVTYQENMESIIRTGLLPAIGELSERYHEEQERVYLFPDKESVDTALLNWGDEWDEDKPLVLLELSVPKAMLKPGEVEWEVYSYEPIPPSCIRRVVSEQQMDNYLNNRQKEDDSRDDR